MNDIFYTHSTNLATYLRMNGFEFVGKNVQNNRTTIYFKRSPELNKCIQDYNNDEKIKKFISCFREVRDYIRS